MKLFLDTANIDDIARINRWGVLDGVTTNPTLAAKEGKDFASMIKEICAEYDWTFSINSRLKSGSCFTISVPVRN